MSDRGYSGGPERPDRSRADACRGITWWLSRCEQQPVEPRPRIDFTRCPDLVIPAMPGP